MGIDEFLELFYGGEITTFEGFNLRGLSLAYETFENLVFQQSSLVGSDFRQTTFLNCQFIECDLSKLSLYESSFEGCSFDRSTFLNLSLGPSLFEECDLSGVNFSGSTGIDVDFMSCDLSNTTWQSARWTGRFIECDLTGANLDGILPGNEIQTLRTTLPSGLYVESKVWTDIGNEHLLIQRKNPVPENQTIDEKEVALLLMNGIHLSSESGIDYQPLAKYLSQCRWLEADEETAYLICKILGHDMIRPKSTLIWGSQIDKIPVSDLNTINNLWLHYSDNHFGIGVQRKIWLETGNDYEVLTEGMDISPRLEFFKRVGWENLKENYSDLAGKCVDRTSILEIPAGYFPMIHLWGGAYALAIVAEQERPIHTLARFYKHLGD
jgi:GUN4-like/Pentapeptide repeats (9 copies)/Pentapeptide repeats (8 copies)